MFRKSISIGLICIILCLLVSGCNSRNIDSGTKYFGTELSADTLRICVDVEYTGVENAVNLQRFFNDFFYTLEDVVSVSNASVEFLPKEGAARESALSRLRTEIMAGGGPDVFIMNCVGSQTLNAGEALFPFPEKNMEAGLFLPLDEYMENHTQFTDWDSQVQVIMEAGRTEEGQLVIPLAYTFPVLAYPADQVDMNLSKDISMQKILSDPALQNVGVALYDGRSKPNENQSSAIYTEHILYMLGKHVDFESEELLFTEEDLQRTIDTMFELQEKTPQIDVDYLEALLGFNLFYDLYRSEENENNSRKKLIPVYSDDGGVTASVLAFAAVNRNTRSPEKAFAVIDVLMREKTQQSSDFFSSFIIPWCGLPMQEDLFQEAKPISVHTSQPWYIRDTYFDELCELREQITAVNFRSKIDLILENLVLDCTLERMSSDMYDKESVSEAYEKMQRMIGE